MWLVALLVTSAAAGSGEMMRKIPNLSQLFVSKRDFCPEWGQWQRSECWWPDTPWEQLPDACTAEQPLSGVPQWFNSFAEGKQREVYDWVQSDFQKRGAPNRCGYCARSTVCRRRNVQPGQTMPEYCKDKEMKTDYSAPQCEGTAPCEMTPEDGVCEPPMWTLTKEFLYKMGYMKKKMMKKGGKSGSKSKEGSKEMKMAKKMMMKEENNGGEMDYEMAEMAISMMDKKVKSTMLGVYIIRNGTNCVMDRASQRCHCCCGPYVPDTQTRQCRDVTPFMPRITTILGDLMRRYEGSDEDGMMRKKRSADEFYFDAVEAAATRVRRLARSAENGVASIENGVESVENGLPSVETGVTSGETSAPNAGPVPQFLVNGQVSPLTVNGQVPPFTANGQVSQLPGNVAFPQLPGSLPFQPLPVNG